MERVSARAQRPYCASAGSEACAAPNGSYRIRCTSAPSLSVTAITDPSWFWIARIIARGLQKLFGGGGGPVQQASWDAARASETPRAAGPPIIADTTGVSGADTLSGGVGMDQDASLGPTGGGAGQHVRGGGLYVSDRVVAQYNAESAGAKFLRDLSRQLALNFGVQTTAPVHVDGSWRLRGSLNAAFVGSNLDPLDPDFEDVPSELLRVRSDWHRVLDGPVRWDIVAATPAQIGRQSVLRTGRFGTEAGALQTFAGAHLHGELRGMTDEPRGSPRPERALDLSFALTHELGHVFQRRVEDSESVIIGRLNAIRSWLGLPTRDGHGSVFRRGNEVYQWRLR